MLGNIGNNENIYKVLWLCETNLFLSKITQCKKNKNVQKK